jgi:tetratricopeptide (TPR) repeat protein
VTSGLLLPLVVLALLALALVLWPLLRQGAGAAGRPTSPADRREEMEEEKRALYRALKELDFDHEAGHLSEEDHATLRARYEARAAQILQALDALPRGEAAAEPRRAVPGGRPAREWTRSPVTLAVGALVLLVFGVTLGLGVARYTEPDLSVIPPGSRLPVAAAPPAGGPAPGGPLAPEMLRGMLDAAHQSLDAGRYQEAIAAYRAVLNRDPRNVEALTHLGVILAIAGHTEHALEAFDKALAIDPGYAHAWWDKGRVLYEAGQDYRGAIEALERFVQLVPEGEDRERARGLIKEATRRLGGARR